MNRSSPVEMSEIPFVSLPDGQLVELEFDSDENAIEIRALEPGGAVAGSVFVPIDLVGDFIKQFRRSIPKQTHLVA